MAEGPGAGSTWVRDRNQRGRAPGLGAPTWDRVPKEVVAFPVPSTACFGDASHYAVSVLPSPLPSCPIPLTFGVTFTPVLLGSLSFISPFLTFLFSKSLPWIRLREEKNTSSQLPALPLASCSGFMFDSNPTIYTAEPWAKPNVSGTCQKPQLFLSPINSFLPPSLHLLPVPF